MKYIILIGLVLMIPIANAITIQETPEITITLNKQGTIDNNNVETSIDDNIYDLYCDDIGNTCKVYRTSTRHTTLTGD